MEEVDDSQICKRLLCEFLDFLKFKLEHNTLTLGEKQGLFKALTTNVELMGTAEDIADFYHKSPQDVRTVVNRRMITPPQRKVHYSMTEFQRIVPPKWREKH